MKPSRMRLLLATLSAGLLVTGTASAQPAKKVTGSSDPIIQYIDKQIKQGWEDNEVKPSPRATDAEWIRRVYLDIAGHIPPLDVVEKFIKDKDPAKRKKIVEKLLDSPDYVRNMTTIWTNLTIGRQTPRRVSRAGMSRFLRRSFARNRPWNDIVYDIVTAEGNFEENGAVNFLLAQMQMNDDGVQATAKTTRLFLGVQVQCTQCHNHPFNKWKQDQFWSFNSFFRQLQKYEHQEYDAEAGRRVFKYTVLRKRDFSGPVYFEKRTGEMKVAYPKFFEKKSEAGAGVDRRKELAKQMVAGDKPLLAKAMVNRMWSHFFGYGFTRPVDDLGPHNPPSHPELLDRLTVEFVKARYDIKRLITWITLSDAYQLTSKFNTTNKVDKPSAGEVPLFSHMYVKAMTAEQLFDSLITATEAHKTGQNNFDAAERQRNQWLQQFVRTFGTDEADEATIFNGTIPQALMMMNGPLITNAISVKPGSFLNDVIHKQKGNTVSKIQKLWMASLSRMPTRKELDAANKVLGGRPNLESSFQDLFWALLNSNEFIFVH